MSANKLREAGIRQLTGIDQCVQVVRSVTALITDLLGRPVGKEMDLESIAVVIVEKCPNRFHPVRSVEERGNVSDVYLITATVLDPIDGTRLLYRS